MKTLLLLRHAKSSWDDPSLSDFDRPLAPRGKKDAPLMGKALKERAPSPDLILSSPAARAKATVKAVVKAAEAPDVGEVADRVCRPDSPARLLLVDTFDKSASARGTGLPETLLHWLPLDEVGDLCRRCRAAGVRLALAGSLRPDQVAALVPFAPDWIAVRGAACDANDRRRDRQHRGEDPALRSGHGLEARHPQPDRPDAGGQGIEDQQQPDARLHTAEIEAQGGPGAQRCDQRKSPQVDDGGDALGPQRAGEGLANDGV